MQGILSYLLGLTFVTAPRLGHPFSMVNDMKLEVLAPCGSRETLTAAVRSGADAVYLGTKDFNARRNADNFDFDTLKEAVRYCHERGVKVYVTVNTLVTDSEMTAAYQTVQQCLQAGCDALIVQDLGLAAMIKRCFPTARLHASTQCAVNTPDGFRSLEAMGFCRAVLPREMSLQEIEEIRRSTTMELEMFVHGALCMCVSGQCYLSAMLGGRSGNRGLCAQPCRLAFSADNSSSCDLSLKDLSLISHISEIAGAGVLSLKIEGRMKRPEYVAAAVTACRKAIDGDYHPADEAVLKNVFSRSGFTDGYFTGKRTDMFGTRRKEDVVAADSVLKELARLYEKEPARLPLTMHLVCQEDKPLSLTATTGGRTVTATAAPPEKAINKPLTEEALRARLSKLGGTPYYLESLSVTLDEGLIAPASVINALRREVTEQLGQLTVPPFEQTAYQPPAGIVKRGTPYYTARFTSAAQVPKSHPFRRLFLPIWEKDETFADIGAGVEIPRGLFGMETALKERLQQLKARGVTQALAGNLGAYKTAEQLGFEVFGDYGLNVFNSESAQLFHAPLLSFELTAEQANRLHTEDTGLIVYGKLPLMLTRNCPVKNRIGCAACGKNGTLTDRKGYRFPVRCSPYPCVEILNPVPLVLSDRLTEIHTDYLHFYFTDETPQQVEEIIRSYQRQQSPTGQYTRGLYYRGVK